MEHLAGTDLGGEAKDSRHSLKEEVVRLGDKGPEGQGRKKAEIFYFRFWKRGGASGQEAGWVFCVKAAFTLWGGRIILYPSRFVSLV